MALAKSKEASASTPSRPGSDFILFFTETTLSGASIKSGSDSVIRNAMLRETAGFSASQNKKSNSGITAVLAVSAQFLRVTSRQIKKATDRPSPF